MVCSVLTLVVLKANAARSCNPKQTQSLWLCGRVSKQVYQGFNGRTFECIHQPTPESPRPANSVDTNSHALWWRGCAGPVQTPHNVLLRRSQRSTRLVAGF
jgi:hypothetical protein